MSDLNTEEPNRMSDDLLNAWTQRGKVDVDRAVLREVVLAGPCPEARAVVDGRRSIQRLDDNCPWCHLVWCIAYEETA